MGGLIWPHVRPLAMRSLFGALGLSERLAEYARIGNSAPLNRTVRSDSGITILIPERSNPKLLEACLGSVIEAREEIEAPSQVVVVASETSERRYRHLMTAKSCVRWLFFNSPLYFEAAVQEGLKVA